MTFRSIQDRWFATDSATGKRVPSARHEQGLRYRARYKDAAGSSGLDVKVVQHRLPHGSAKSTLDTYGPCGRTATSPHEPPWEQCWRLVRTVCGLAVRDPTKPQVSA